MNRPILVLLAAVALLGAAPAPRGIAAQAPTPHWRPLFHFTPPVNWINDPNGMVYFEGEYHLFYQYNPFGDKWGHMSWGHAVSPDLVRWEHLPVALWEEDGVMAFSGSAVVDWDNTSGFGVGGKPPLVAIYTGHYTSKPLQNQWIAHSNDRGRTWTKFAGNPVLDVNMADFRDPKVVWHQPTKRWIMTLALPAEHKVHFYASPDLKEWRYVGEYGGGGALGGLWECPDLFPLEVEGGGVKWVLIVNLNPGGPAGGSGCQYFVGEFDGATFTPDSPATPEPAFVPKGRVLANFEGSYGDWRAEGDAFGTGPARGALPGQQAVGGYLGNGLANSFLQGDSSRGTLTSPEFEIDAPHLSFLIGGGAHPETRMELWVDGEVARQASGANAEALQWRSWDLRPHQGKRGRLRIVDDHTGGWGHINVDEIILADTPARPPKERALWADFGADFYAAVSWSDIPKADGRRLWLGWMSNWDYANEVPTSPWRGAMSVPRELGLRQTAGGLRLVQRPVRELASLRGPGHRIENTTWSAAATWLAGLPVQGPALEVFLEVEGLAAGDEWGLALATGPAEATTLRWSGATSELSLDRTRSGLVDFHPKFKAIHTAPAPANGGRLDLRLLVDTSSIEVFAAGGQTVLTDLILPSPGPRRLRLDPPAPGAGPRIRNLQVWPLLPPATPEPQNPNKPTANPAGN